MTSRSSETLGLRPLVLVVDDSLTVRKDLEETLHDADLDVELCASVAAARVALETLRFAAAILDVVLPDGDGVDLLAELRARPATRALPVLLLSTEAAVADRLRGLRVGADEYVGKPYDRGQLLARLRAVMGAPARAPASRGRLKILVIDDSATVRGALAALLESAGYEVILAETAGDGLRLAGVHALAAAIVDGSLPDKDGRAVIRTMRLDPQLRRLPALLLTGEAGVDKELDALDAGADGFIRKGDDYSVLLATLAAVLRDRQVEHPDTAEPDGGAHRLLALSLAVDGLHDVVEGLRSHGYDVANTRSATEAIDLLSVQHVDGILIDVSGEPEGLTSFVARVRSAPGIGRIPILALTDDRDLGAVVGRRSPSVRALQAGADDVVAHGAPLDVVLARMAALMRRKRVEDEARRARERVLERELAVRQAQAARALAETRQALVAQLEAKNEELEAFTYSVSHDLRAPLRSILGFTRLLREGHAETLDAKGREHLDRVVKAATRMNELIEDLLELARVSRAGLRVRRLNVSEVAREVLAALQAAEPAREVEVAIESGIAVDADSGLLRIVLENLLGNAWKFTSKTAHARITVNAVRADGTVRLRIADNGAGFDSRHGEKLFRPFARLHSEREFPGTGIGLATVQKIITRHGGSVSAEGQPGLGASFTLTLPIVDGPEGDPQ